MKKISIPKPKPVGLQFIELVLKSRKINFVLEHKFLSDRKYRFDIAIPEKKIAIEYEDWRINSREKKADTLRVWDILTTA